MKNVSASTLKPEIDHSGIPGTAVSPSSAPPDCSSRSINVWSSAAPNVACEWQTSFGAPLEPDVAKTIDGTAETSRCHELCRNLAGRAVLVPAEQQRVIDRQLREQLDDARERVVEHELTHDRSVRPRAALEVTCPGRDCRGQGRVVERLVADGDRRRGGVRAAVSANRSVSGRARAHCGSRPSR